jgi:hypothetical protein
MIREYQLMILAFWLLERPKRHDHEPERAAARGKAAR